MIVTINNESGTTTYDVSKVKDESIRTQATVMINKVGQLEVLFSKVGNKYSNINLIGPTKFVFKGEVYV